MRDLELSDAELCELRQLIDEAERANKLELKEKPRECVDRCPRLAPFGR